MVDVSRHPRVFVQYAVFSTQHFLPSQNCVPHLSDPSLSAALSRFIANRRYISIQVTTVYEYTTDVAAAAPPWRRPGRTLTDILVYITTIHATTYVK